MTFRSLVQRLLALTRTRRLDRELDDEVRAHLELAERDARAAGLSPEEARRTARRNFGGLEQMKETHRDERSVRSLDTLMKDVRYGLLMLVRDPGFAVVAISVMAIGIGANTAMFSLVDAVLLKPLPFADPDRIVRVMEAPTPTSRNGITTLNFLDWKRLSTSFEALSATRGLSVALTGQGEPARLGGLLVSSDYFEVFGVKPVAGRTFRRDEDQPGASPVVVLSHATWQTRFGGDPSILNREVMLDGEPHQVVGILAAGTFAREETGFWKPLVFAPDQRTRSYHWLGAVGRLKGSVSLEQAREEMRAVSASLVELQPPFKKTWGVAVDPFDRTLVGDNLRRTIYVAFGAVVMVLLIAAANIANLLLAKGVTRSKEMAVRAALGASRGRLVAQMLTESLVLCLFGGMAGVGLAYFLIEVAVPVLTPSLPPTATVGLDLRVLGFAAAVAVTVSLVVGLLPSLQNSSGRLSQALNRVSRGASGSREGVRRAIVVAEVAVSLVLICGAVLMFKSLLKLQRVDAGVRIDNVITMSADLSLTGYPDAERATQFIDAVSERLRAVPGVERAAISTDVPLLGVRQGDLLSIPGSEDGVGVRFKRVDPRYFETLDIPVVKGRGISDRDRTGAPRVVVINETLAGRLAERFGMRDPVGKIARLVAPAYENRGQLGTQSRRRDHRRDPQRARERFADGGTGRGLRAAGPGAAARDQADRPDGGRRRRGDARHPRGRAANRSAPPAGRRAHDATDSERSLSGVSDPTWAIGAFAGVAALLAALGLYGVLSHAVNQQRREIGIRMALGARAGDVLVQMLRQAMGMIAVGLAAGSSGCLRRHEVHALNPVRGLRSRPQSRLPPRAWRWRSWASRRHSCPPAGRHA